LFAPPIVSIALYDLQILIATSTLYSDRHTALFDIRMKAVIRQ